MAAPACLPACLPARPPIPRRARCALPRWLVTQKHVGDALKLDVLRGGQELALEVRRPLQATLGGPPPAAARLQLPVGAHARRRRQRSLAAASPWLPAPRPPLSFPCPAPGEALALPVPGTAPPAGVQALLLHLWRPGLHCLLGWAPPADGQPDRKKAAAAVCRAFHSGVLTGEEGQGAAPQGAPVKPARPAAGCVPARPPPAAARRPLPGAALRQPGRRACAPHAEDLLWRQEHVG